jgi:hypothetical protein
MSSGKLNEKLLFHKQLRSYIAGKICYQKTKDLLYPVLPKKKIPGYLEQVGNNNKMAYKSTCKRLYVHMRCGMIVKDLKWMQEKFTKYHVTIKPILI